MQSSLRADPKGILRADPKGISGRDASLMSRVWPLKALEEEHSRQGLSRERQGKRESECCGLGGWGVPGL